MVDFDRHDELLRELLCTAEQPRIDKLEQIPQLREVVLDGRSGEFHLALSLQFHRSLRHLRVRILDSVRLIEACHVPLLCREVVLLVVE